MEENQKKRSFGSGIGIGLVLGMLFSGIVCVGIAFIYPRVAGKYLVLGRHGVAAEEKSDFLNREVVEKVDELSEYIDLYYLYQTFPSSFLF